MKPGPDVRLSMYRTMALIAACDEALRRAIGAGQAVLSYYSPRGQEAVAAALGAVLRRDDYLVTTYRGMHDQIAKGVPLELLLAEMLGRARGTAKGKGGPMHIAWPDAGLMVTTGIVGSGLPIAAGLAWAAQRQGQGRVALVCFGDGASNIGAFHEACNLAALWQLPLVLLCQNNRYGEHTAFAHHQRSPSVASRAGAYAMPGVTVDGNDPVATYEVLAQAVEQARQGGGPTLVEAMTYRLYGHVYGDSMAYVDAEELRAAWDSEPVARFAAALEASGLLSADERRAMDEGVAQEADATLDRVLAMPEPGPEELLTDVVGA
ncbi:MAG: thiamine pyrophosphate-dependent dehydrogenase E1 component subunit alpha [Acidimicrobiales bacterium]